MEILTTNIADFGLQELHEAALIFTSLEKHGYPEEFRIDGIVSIAFNANIGNVYLINDKGQKATVNTDPGCGELFMVYSLPENGFSGAAEDILEEYHSNPSAFSETDIEYMTNNGLLKNSEHSFE